MNDIWYISRNGIQYGPYSIEAMKMMAQNGNLVPNDMVWSQQTVNWIQASNVKEIFPNIQKTYNKNINNRYIRTNQHKVKKSFFKRATTAIMIVLIVCIVLSTILPQSKTADSDIKSMEINANIASLMYTCAANMTDMVLNSGPDDVSYDVWSQGMHDTISFWKQVEEKSIELEQLAQKVIDADEKKEKKTTLSNILNILTVQPCFAITDDEIIRAYDNAPKGKKLQTLAKLLKTDARTALTHLEQLNSKASQDWNNKADFYQKCENTAKVIKGASKVAVFVAANGAILAGGAATAFEAISVVVTGADLVLEIAEDAATILVGDPNDERVKIISDARILTKPAAALMGFKGLENGGKLLNDLIKNGTFSSVTGKWAKLKELMNVLKQSKNMSNWDMPGSVIFGADQIVGKLNDGELVGVKVEFTSKDIVEEVKQQLKLEAKIMNKNDTKKVIDDMLPIKQASKQTLDKSTPITTNPTVTTKAAEPPKTIIVNPEDDHTTEAQKLANYLAGTWKPYGKLITGGDGAIFHIEKEDYSEKFYYIYTFDTSGIYRSIAIRDHIKKVYENERDRAIGEDMLNKSFENFKAGEMNGNFYFENINHFNNAKWTIDGRNEQGELNIMVFSIEYEMAMADGTIKKFKPPIGNLINDKWMVISNQVFVK